MSWQDQFEEPSATPVKPVAVPSWADQFETADAPVVAGSWQDMFEEEKTPLFSLKGAGSLLSTLGPRIERGILGTQLKFLEERQMTREGRIAVLRAQGKELPKSEEWALGGDNSEAILATRQAMQEVDKRLEAARGNPSYPLEIGQEVVGNIVQNAPGIAFGAATHRELGPLAAAPALIEAYRSTSGQSYADVRTPDPKTGETKLSVGEASRHAENQGAIELAFELTPTSYLLRNLGKEGLAKLVKGYLIRDIGTELGTTAAQKIEERISVEPDKPIGEFLVELKDELITTGLVTAISAPITGGMAHGIAKAGRLGKQRTDEPVELPGRIDPIAEQGDKLLDVSGGFDGSVGTLQNAPSPDLPTNQLDTNTITELQVQASMIHPESIDEKTLAESARVVAEIKAKEEAPPLPEAAIAWGQITLAPASIGADTGELGASARQADNASNYINPNQGDRLDRPITRGPDEAVGLTPRQYIPKPGTYGLGIDTEDRPPDYLDPYIATVEQLRQKWLPHATIVVSNEQMYNNSALGGHYTSGKGKHLIVPAVLRRPSRGWGAFNPNTIASAFFNLTHEFGHALISDRFYEVDSDETVGAIRQASESGLVPEELIAKLPAPQQAVVREFNKIKNRILNDQMTAQQFIDEWMGPAKIARKTFLKKLGVSPDAPAKQLVNAIVQLAEKNANVSDIKTQAATRQQAVEEFLGIHEYLAEQVARFAYKNKWEQSTPLGQFFGNILSGLRGMFVDAKKDGIIASGTAFSDWMEGLGKMPRPVEEKEVLQKRRKAMPGKPKAAIAAKPAAKPRKKKAAAPKVETVQHNIESDTHKAWEVHARGAVINLVRTGKLKREDGEYAELMGYANRDEREEFRQEFARVSGKTVSFELDSKKPDNFLDDSKYLYHAVRNDQDLDTIFAEGLRPGTNLSDLGGQAFTDEGGTFLVLERKASKKAYQGDYVNQGTLRPVAILKDTLIHEKKGYTQEQSNAELDKIEAEFVALEKKTWLSEKERDREQDRLLRRSDGVLSMTNKPTLDTEGIIAQYTRHGVPVIPVEVRYDEKTDKTKVFRKRGTKFSYELDVTQEDDWSEGKFSSPGFKAFFGDWERDPEGSSKIRVAAFRQHAGIISLKSDVVSPPLVLFTTQARLSQGLNAFHASTPAGQQYAEARSADSPEDGTLVPVVLNIRRPFIQGDLHDPAPSRADLEAQGYDGIVYQNDFNGDLSFVVFRPQQIKVVPEKNPYSNQKGFSLELDTDQSTPEGYTIAKFYNAIKNFSPNPARMLRSLKHSARSVRYVMQMQQIAQKNPSVDDVQFFDRTNTESESYRSSRLTLPNKVLDYFGDMSNKDFDKVSKFIRAQAESGKRWLPLAETYKLINGRTWPWWETTVDATTEAKAKEFGIDTSTKKGKELLTHIKNFENSLLDSLNEDERIIGELLAHRYGHNNLAYLAMIHQLKAQIHEMRKRPFLPRKWFGTYQLVVSEKAAVGYEVIHKEGYDSLAERDAAFVKIQARLPKNRIVQKKELTDHQYVMMGLPKDFLDTVAAELGLEKEQVRRLSEILQPVKQEKLLRERDLKELGITGESQDIMRSYADYTWHHANLQTKMIYRKRFNMAIGRLSREVEELSYTDSQDFYRKHAILESMKAARDYIMSPPHEWHTVRATISLAYLLGNVKTALANGTGLLLTWTDLTGRHGSWKGEMLFYQAVYRNSVDVWAKGKLPDYIQKGLVRAKQEGVFDQTMAYHVAGMANANRLWRALSRRKVIRYFQKDIELGMMPFRMMELFTRRVTFLAALEENSNMIDQRTGKKLDFEQAYQRSVKKVGAVQNDYTAGNRIPLMRGKASLVTIFMSFPQHAGWHSLGQYESGQRALVEHEIKIGMRPESDRPTQTQKLHGHTMRIWAVMLMLGGYLGEPFAENFLDIVEWIWKRFGKKTIRQELRDIVTPLVDQPHLWSRGFAHSVFGLDFSRSVGWGELLPGTNLLNKNAKDNFDEKVGTMALDLAGVTGNTLKWLYDSGFNEHKPFEQAMRSAPGLGGNMWNAYQWSKHGVRGPAGGKITVDPKTGELRDLTAKELWAKAMGFNPEIVSHNREINYEIYDRTVHWKTRRDGLKAAIWRGEVQEDPDYEREARKAVEEFNEWLGDDPEWRVLRIDNADISKYLKLKRIQQMKEENQQPREKRFRRLHEDIRASHEGPEDE